MGDVPSGGWADLYKFNLDRPFARYLPPYSSLDEAQLAVNHNKLVTFLWANAQRPPPTPTPFAAQNAPCPFSDPICPVFH